MATYIDAEGNLKELQEGEYVLTQSPGKMKAWVPTPSLRFVKTEEGVKLQQRWSDWLSSDTEWRFVPLEEEPAAD